MSIQANFKKDLFELLKRHHIIIIEDYHTPYQQSGYEFISYSSSNEENVYSINIKINS